MPKLSVIVPVYNTKNYLRECIDSILVQTFTDFELILVDDGSTDGSGVVCDEYADKDPRIRVIHQENGGATVARRSGVSCADGEYITFVDSDDWISKEMYAVMMAQLPADIVICGIKRVTNNGMHDMKSIIEEGSYDKQKLNESFYPTMLFNYEHCQPGIHPSLCNKLIRSKIIRNVINDVDDSITYGEDALCSFACMLDANRISVIGQSLYYYRENLGSVSNIYNKHMLDKMILLEAEFERQFSSRNMDLQSQLSGYISRHSLECIRNELMYHTNATFEEKQSNILNFVNNPLIQQSFHFAIPRIYNPKTKLKMILVKHKMIGMLNLLYLSRKVLSKGKNNKN